jgi:hypothetical protein
MRYSHSTFAGCLLAALVPASPAETPPGNGPAKDGVKLSAEELDRLIMQLGDDDLATRASARKQLEKIGEPAVAGLKTAAEAADDPVVRQAAKSLLDVFAQRARGEAPFSQDPEPVGLLGPVRFSALDLQGLANQNRTATFHQDNMPGNNLGGLAAGEHRLLEIPFRVGAGVLQLGSQLVVDKPAEIRGIKVGRKLTQLYVLHASGYSGDQQDGVSIGHYTVRYDDGATRTIPLVNGRDVRGWWKRPRAPKPSRGKVAWEGTNDYVKRQGFGLWLFLSVWENLRPDMTVVSMDYVSAMTKCAPFCVAITTAAPLRAQVPAAPSAAGDLERLWKQLGTGDDPGYDAVEALAGLPGQTVPFLAAKLRAAQPEAVERRVGALIARLDDPEFAVRQRATQDLETFGPEAHPYLRRSLGEPVSLEVRRRVEGLLAKPDVAKFTADQRRWQNALTVYELIGTADTRKALDEVSHGSAGAWLASSAQASLKRLAKKQD